MVDDSTTRLEGAHQPGRQRRGRSQGGAGAREAEAHRTRGAVPRDQRDERVGVQDQVVSHLRAWAGTQPAHHHGLGVRRLPGCHRRPHELKFLETKEKNMNPLADILPTQVRKYLYAAVFLALIVYAAFQAADGDWGQM